MWHRQLTAVRGEKARQPQQFGTGRHDSHRDEQDGKEGHCVNSHGQDPPEMRDGLDRAFAEAFKLLTEVGGLVGRTEYAGPGFEEHAQRRWRPAGCGTPVPLRHRDLTVCLVSRRDTRDRVVVISAFDDYCSRRKMRFLLNFSGNANPQARRQYRTEVRIVGHNTVRGSASPHLAAVPNPVRFEDLVHSVRRKNGWTQAQLAARLGISRPQTVSGWERGTKPQRRHYAKIAAFLGLPDERAVEALLSGDPSGVDDVPASQSSQPPTTTELQRRAVEAIVFQLEGSKWKPSDKLAQLLNDLLSGPSSQASTSSTTRTPARILCARRRADARADDPVRQVQLSTTSRSRPGSR